LGPFTTGFGNVSHARVNFRSKLASVATGVEVRFPRQPRNASRDRLLARSLQHFPINASLTHRRMASSRRTRVASRNYLRALRAAEMLAWEAGPLTNESTS
jgi:hypothetical protein